MVVKKYSNIGLHHQKVMKYLVGPVYGANTEYRVIVIVDSIMIYTICDLYSGMFSYVPP